MIGLNIMLGMILWNLVMSMWHYKKGYRNKFLYCGLIGFSGETDFNPKYIDINIVWNSLERGEDATGLFSPKNGVKKSLTKGSHYVLHSKNEMINDNYLIAHVRAATVGLKTEVNNAHPFERGNFILAHNGTLFNHSDLADKYNLAKADYSVDSDIIAGCINEVGDIATVLKEINGAAALLIHDKRNPKVLYAFTNGERPLWRGNDNKGNMYISSLGETLYFLGLTGIKEFKKNNLYSIENGKIIDHKKIKNVPYIKPTVFTTTTTTTRNQTRSYNDGVDYWKDCWVRASFTAANMFEKTYVEVFKGDYYNVVGQDPDKERCIIIKYNGEDVSVYKSFFEQNDIIHEGDYLKLRVNQVSNTGTLEATKGDIVIATQVYQDGDVTTKFFEAGRGALSFRNKSNFIPLTPDEKAALFIVPNTNFLEAIAESSRTAPTCDIKRDENIQIMVGEALLDDFFIEFDEKVEELNDIAAKTNNVTLKAKVVELLDLIFIARNELLEPNITT